MSDFILKNKEILVIFLIWFVAGSFNAFFGISVVVVSLFLFYKKLRIEDVLLSLFFLIILSDSYLLSFAKQSKPLGVLLLTFFVFRKAKELPKVKFIIPFLPFFIYTLFLLFLSPKVSVAAQKNIAYILIYLSVPIVLIYQVNKQGKNAILNFTRIAMIILAVGLAMKYLNPYQAHSHGGRLKGTFGNPNGLGMFCFFSYALFVICKDYLKCNVSRIENIAFHALILLSLVWSGSRGSLFGLLIFLIAKPITKVSPFLPFIIFPIPILFFDEITVFAVEMIQDLGLQKVLRVSSIEELKTGSGRAVAREFAWKEIQNAFYFGRGWRYDEIWIYGPIQQTLNLLNHQGGVHNSYLILWLNTGLVGIILFFSALIYTVAQAAKKSNLAIPIFFGAMFIANFEPWLVGSLNPYTIQFVMCLTIFIYLPKGDENLSEGIISTDNNDG